MKLLRLVLIFNFLFCSFIFANGQTIHTKQSNCQLGVLSFTCPKDLELKIDNNSNGFFLAESPKYKFAVFAFVNKPMLKKEEFNQILGKVLAKYFSTNFSDYIWKNSNDYGEGNSWSKYETLNYSKFGFNKTYQHTIGVKASELVFENNNIVIGYLYEDIKGDYAEELFKNSLGGSSFPASESLLETISNITGESKKEINSSPSALPPMRKPMR